MAIADIDSGNGARKIAASFDLTRLPPEFYADPYPYYRALREHEPVKHMPDGSWFLTRYDDIVPVYRDFKAFSSDKKKEFGAKYGPTPLFEHHTTSLIFNDPPLHTRVRRAIVGAISQRHIAAMEPGLIKLVDGLLSAMNEEREVDLIDDFAAAIPIGIIGNLLGVAHDERGPLRGWSLDILGALEPVLTVERAARGNRAVTDMLAYLKILVDERRAHLRDPDTDVLTRLIAREPNRHLAFAFGIHTCAGINLARLEARVALSRFLSRFPRYALTGTSMRDARARFRGFLHLPGSVAA